MTEKRRMKFSIYRYDPDRDAKPYMQDIEVELLPTDKMLLDALMRIKLDKDDSVSFRRSCREGVCGSDAMNINGKNGLACIANLLELKEPVVLKPLPGLPVIRDLIVELATYEREAAQAKATVEQLNAALFAPQPAVFCLIAEEGGDGTGSGEVVGFAMWFLTFSTWLGQHAGWRSAYWLVSGLAALTALLVLWLVPHVAANRDATGRNELSAFRNPQVLLTLLAGAIGFGGMFAVYTYIAPTVTEVAGLGEGRVPLYLLAMGLGMVVGTPLGGRLADWSIFRSLLVSSVAMIAILVASRSIAHADLKRDVDALVRAHKPAHVGYVLRVTP